MASLAVMRSSGLMSRQRRRRSTSSTSLAASTAPPLTSADTNVARQRSTTVPTYSSRTTCSPTPRTDGRFNSNSNLNARFDSRFDSKANGPIRRSLFRKLIKDLQSALSYATRGMAALAAWLCSGRAAPLEAASCVGSVPVTV